jgi:hypothetical protein
MRINTQPRRGKIAVLVALSLVGIVGVTAIAVDGGLLMDERQRAQSAADAAALAAATDLFAKWRTNGGADSSAGDAKTCALANAAAEGYANDGVTSIVTVNIPPASGPYATKPGCAEVIIQYNQQRAFSNIFGDGAIPVKARAVARAKWVPNSIGILVLDPSGRGALNGSAGGNLTMTGASVLVNSSDPSGAILSGSGGMTAPEFDFTGNPGWLTSGTGRFNGTMKSSLAAVSDPLQNRNPPDPSKLPLVHSGSTLNITDVDPAKGVTLSPGVYQRGISISAIGSGTVTMQPGIYYMQGGGFQFTGSTSLVGNGVMIYNAPTTSSEVVSITGSGSVTLSPPTAGSYTGFTIWQDRTSNVPLTIGGTGTTNITGTFYAAGATLNIAGSGSGTNVIGSQYIANDLALTGSGNVNINYSGGTVAPVRLLGLVE